jgi:hypothetical protein
MSIIVNNILTIYYGYINNILTYEYYILITIFIVAFCVF